VPYVRKKIRNKSWKNILIGSGIALLLLMIVYLFAGQVWQLTGGLAPVKGLFGQVEFQAKRVARHVRSMIWRQPPPPPRPVLAFNPPGAPVPAAPRQVDPVSALVDQAFELMQQNQLDAALEKVNAALKLAPQSSGIYELRGNIYTVKKMWDPAQKDYLTVLQLDATNVQAKFNMAEIQFMQKKYDSARPGFVALMQDANIGDLAAYKVFLCDLLGGHDDAATRELDIFNQTGLNPSYYFGNIAWSTFHHKTEEARGWVRSAASIYSVSKYKLYATSLTDLGYLPLPPVPKN
jgi:tetratricopeptide (TPR) repeat protein